VLLSTATQPALTSRLGFGSSFRPLGSVTEIVDDPDALYGALERVRVTIPRQFDTPTNWETLAGELQRHRQVLCIVNRRSDCRELFRLMPESAFHLSALMCGEHRSETLDAIRQKLKAGEDVRVISTQLVEAGVDFDFPVVYRAMAGLDSIAQAAGRCNREGSLERGEVIVFVPPTPPPIGVLRKAEQISRSLLSSGLQKPLERSQFTAFFELLYGSTDLDREGVIRLLQPGTELDVAFRTAAAKFKLIDDTAYQAVLIPYKEGAELVRILASRGPERWLMRKLQRYTVNLSKGSFKVMLARGDIRPQWRDSYFALVSPALYDETIGVVLPNDSIPAEDLVI
jgi:CRISPR-associated endonuclease/helicase Cas3